MSYLDDDLAENVRRFGPSKYIARLRRRMTKYVQGGGESAEGGNGPTPHPSATARPEPHKFPCEDPYCDPCNEAIKRIFRDVGVLPKGMLDYAALTAEPIEGRLKIPARWRKDESDV